MPPCLCSPWQPSDCCEDSMIVTAGSRYPRCVSQPGRLRAATLIGFLLASGFSPPATDGAIEATWREVALDDLAGGLPPLIGRPVVLDCRIDPTQAITLVADDLEPLTLIEKLGQLSGAEAIVLRECVRLSPSGRRDPLQAAEEQRARELARAAPRIRKPLTERKPTQWRAGATPQEIVRSLAEAAGAEISGMELIPHDHLRGQDLPEMSRAAQLDLVLANYDLRAEVLTTSLRVVRLDPEARAQQPPRLPAPETQPQRGMAGQSNSRFTLKAAATLSQLLAAIAAQEKLTLQIDAKALRMAGVEPDVVVRLEMQDATLGMLLDAITQPLSLSWEVAENTLRITADGSQSDHEPAGGGRPQD
jgi:hypothetical protein